MVRRWQQLPLDRALSCMPRVRLLITELATATPPGPAGHATVPDLGPAAVMDQLTVLVYDACATADEGAGPAASLALAARLVELRRDLG